MKFLVSFITLVAMGSVANADLAYRFKTLNCVGKINSKPSGMQPDYTYMGMSLIAFNPTKRDGTKASALGWNICYGKSGASVATPLNAGNCRNELWYSGLLGRDSSTGTIGRDGLKLKVIDTNHTSTSITLTGTYSRSGTVVGDYFYNLNCVANK